MTREELLSRVSLDTHLPQTIVAEVLHALVGVFGDELGSGGEVHLPLVGTFRVHLAKSRRVGHPWKDEIFIIPAMYRVRFKTSSPLAARVKAGKGQRFQLSIQGSPYHSRVGILIPPEQYPVGMPLGNWGQPVDVQKEAVIRLLSGEYLTVPLKALKALPRTEKKA